MRALLFNGVAATGAFLVNAISWVAKLLTSAVALTGGFLMNLIDKKRLEVHSKLAEALLSPLPSELDQQGTELELLAKAIHIRDHALETQAWTDQHSAYIETVAQELVLYAGWDVSDVDSYIKGVVETIDGLEYGAEDL